MTDKLSDQLTANFLQAAIISLRHDVVPAISDPSARIHADLITRVLYLLHGRVSNRGEDLQRLLAKNHALLKDINALVANQSTATSKAPSDQNHFSAIDKLETKLYADELQLVSNIPQLLELASKDGPEKQAAVACLSGIVSAQQEFLSSQDPDILKGSYVCYQGGKIEEEQPVIRSALYGAEVTEASLTQHLQKEFPGSHVEKVSVMAGGFSKTTIFFTLVHATGKSEPLVMRKDIPVPGNSSVADEFPLLQKVFRAGFPVAEPYWLESDPRPFGGCFMASHRVGGSTDFSRWAGDSQAVDGFARQLAKLMADLHSLKLEQLAYPADISGKSAGDLMREEIRRWHDIFVSHREEAFPIQEIAMAWLAANIPQTLFSRPANLVHGDIGFHNLMIDNGKVTALLDWEFAHPGDPVEDLIYTKPFIEKVMDWETFKSFYREYGGVTSTVEEEFFYTVWAKTRNQATSIRAGSVFSKSMPDNIMFATAGHILGRYLELEAGNMIVDQLGK